MTPDDTLERHLVESMVSVAASGSPDYLDDILGRSSRTRQRRARPLQRSVFPARAPHERAGWRTGRSYMTPIARIAAVAALALAVGVVIDPLRPSNQYGVSDPSPSASPSPVLLEGYAPSLAAGTYQQPLDTGTWTVTVPEGWEEFYSVLWADVDGVSDPPTTGGPGEVALGWWDVTKVFADPCHWQDSLADPPVGPTVDDLATAFAEQVGRDGSTTDVVFAGYPAKRVELSTPADLDVATCDEGVYWEFMAPGEPRPESTPDAAGMVRVLYILDFEGTMMMNSWHRPDASPEDLAEMEAMLASSRIDPPLVRGWPGTRLDNPAGVYSWTPGGQPRSWMHNYHESGDVEITFGTWDGATDSTRSIVMAAGYDDRSFPDGPVRVPDERPVGSAESRTQVWLLDVDGTRVFMLIEATPGTPAGAWNEAEAIIRSVRVGPPSLGPGIVLTFELPAGWDSG